MTKEQILKDCEFDAAYKIWQLVGQPSVVNEYEERLGIDGMTTWAKDHWPNAFAQLSAEFKDSVEDRFYLIELSQTTEE